MVPKQKPQPAAKSRYRTPLSYYGGKQRMLRHILPLIPPHEVYTEAFAGGAAVFWAKAPCGIEVLNDLNGEIVNFYQVAKTQAQALANHIAATPHSRNLHKLAEFVYDHPHLFDPVKRAWAVWVQCTLSFASMIKGGYGYSRNPSASGIDSLPPAAWQAAAKAGKTRLN